MTTTIEDVIRAADGLRGYLIADPRSGEVRQSWVREHDELEVDDLAFGAVNAMRAQREMLSMLGPGPLVEFATRADSGLVQSIVLDSGLLLVVVCEPDVALGMGRLFARRVAVAWTHEHVDESPSPKRSRAAMIVDEVDAALELARAARVRLALRAGVAPRSLDSPNDIGPEQTAALEREAVALGYWDALDAEEE